MWRDNLGDYSDRPAKEKSRLFFDDPFRGHLQAFQLLQPLKVVLATIRTARQVVSGHHTQEFYTDAHSGTHFGQIFQYCETVVTR
jgi:hypothetical protein